MKLSSSLFAGLSGLFLAGLLLFLPVPAYAESTADWACQGDKTLNQIFCGITTQFRFMPALLSIFSYAIAAFLGVTGLLQLKQYGDDPSRTPLQGIIIRLALSAMLVSLPFAMQVFVTTVTGSDNVTQAQTHLSRKPSLGSGVSGTK